MRKNITFLAAAALMSAALTAPLFAQGLKAVRATTPPRIDGVLDDACWKAAPPVENFLVMDTNTPSPFKTTARFAFDDDSLYISIQCFTPDLALVKAEKVKKDTGGIINQSDSVEVMIDCRGDANEYVHLATNSSGSQFDRRVGQGGWVAYDWDGDWRSASTIGADSYTVEMAVPFYDLGINTKTTNNSWRINVCRNVRMPGTSAYTSLAERGAYNTPARFRPLAGMDADFTRYLIAISPVRVTTRFADKKTFATIEVDATNDSAAARNLAAEDWLIESEQKVLVKEIGAFALEPGKKKTLTFGPYELVQSGKFQNRVALNDAKSRRPLAVSSSPVDITCVPIALRVIEPFYRNTLFATQKIEKVVLNVDVGLDDAARAAASLDFAVLTAGRQKALMEKALKGLAPVNRIEFDSAQLPAEGKFILKVTLRDNAGAELANTEQMLLKLPYKKGEVWVGRNLAFYRDGKPIFPNGGWGMMTPARNFLLYGIFKERLVHPVIPGKYKVWYFTSGTDDKELRGPQPFSEEFIKDFRERIRFYRDDVDILAWVSVDEPECANLLPAKLKQLYEICREEDPYHPVWISNDSAEGVEKYAGCADAAVPHPYPAAQPDMPIGDFTPVLNAQDAYLEYTNFTKPVGYMHQGFNYGEYVRGRRMPTYYELRNQNILSLADGGTFLMGFESSVPQLMYPEVSIGLDYLAQELAYLGRAVCAPKAANKVTCPTKDVLTLLKDADGDLFLFVSNASNSARKLAVTVEGLGAKKMAVVSEARSVEPKDGLITDSFDPWQTHIYTTSTQDSGLKTTREIIEMIEAEYAKRHKANNLAFQRWSNGSVDISYSSRAGEYPPEPWHICDGIIDPGPFGPRFVNEYTWTDGTPNESPDWVALKFPKAHKISRVAVTMEKNSIKEYKIQVMRGADWADVAQGTNTDAGIIDKSFDAVVTDQVRLLVTATNGPNVIVTEMEVYGE